MTLIITVNHYIFVMSHLLISKVVKSKVFISIAVVSLSNTNKSALVN
jgi:hypothetical protein